MCLDITLSFLYDHPRTLSWSDLMPIQPPFQLLPQHMISRTSTYRSPPYFPSLLSKLGNSICKLSNNLQMFKEDHPLLRSLANPSAAMKCLNLPPNSSWSSIKSSTVLVKPISRRSARLPSGTGVCLKSLSRIPEASLRTVKEDCLNANSCMEALGLPLDRTKLTYQPQLTMWQTSLSK